MFEKPARTLIGAMRLGHSAVGRGLRDRDEDGLAAGLRDLLLRALRERVGRDGDRLGQLAVAEDLDAVGAALDEPALAERALVDLRAGVEQLELR